MTSPAVIGVDPGPRADADRLLLPGASHIPTTAFQLAQSNAQAALNLGKVASFTGDPGTGKTHAVEYFIAHNAVDHAWITASPTPQRKEIFEELLIELTGGYENATASVLRRQLQALLADRHPFAIVVDEAQYLSTMWLQQLRNLHDRRDARWALLLVGGSGARRNLKRSPELWSRNTIRTTFEPLAGSALYTALAAYHPVLAHTDREILKTINDRDCRGNLRDWVSFLELALPMLPNTPTPDRLTEKVVRAVFARRDIK